MGVSGAEKWMEKAGLEALNNDLKDPEFHRKSERFRKTLLAG